MKITTSEHLAAECGMMSQFIGSWVLTEPSDDFRLEILVGTDSDGRRIHMPITLRHAHLEAAYTVTHCADDDGQQTWVSHALGDPLAVQEFVRIILSGDPSTSCDTHPLFTVQGSDDTGYDSDVCVDNVIIREATEQTCVGFASINGHLRSFTLYVPRLLSPERGSSESFDTAKLNLRGWLPSDPDEKYVIAELSWRE